MIIIELHQKILISNVLQSISSLRSKSIHVYIINIIIKVAQQPESSGESSPIENPPVEWMSVPSNVPSCPPGLEYLTHLDQLLIFQQVEIFEGKMFIEYSKILKLFAYYLSIQD